MKFDYPAPEGVLMPYELAMLQRLFNRALRKQGYAKTDVEAKMLATTMMDLYRRGLRDEPAARRAGPAGDPPLRGRAQARVPGALHRRHHRARAARGDHRGRGARPDRGDAAIDPRRRLKRRPTGL